MDEVARRFPDLKMVMAHMAHPWQIDCIVTIRKHPNLFADISGLFYRPWSFYNCLRLAYEWGVMHKLLFGSDFPFSTPQENLDAFSQINDMLEGTLLPRVPEEELAAIIQRDSLQLLGVEG
jgi:predicted TIM-barrel fold metal-dependent hydrolase